MAEIDSSSYWKTPFSPVCSTKKLEEFTIIDINEAEVHSFTGQGQISHKVSSLIVHPKLLDSTQRESLK